MALTDAQIEQLLKGINPGRVSTRDNPGGGGRKLSYLEAWDVKAHLIRIFGFGGWSWEVIEAAHAFTESVEIGRDKRPGFHVGYRVVGRLTIVEAFKDRDACYMEAAVGSASLQALGDAHDMAIKTAESDALKRASICLGDQFGLSLYKNGQIAPVVQGLITRPAAVVSDGQTDEAGSES